MQNAGYTPGVPHAPEVKSKSNRLNPMPNLIGSQEALIIGQTFYF